MECLIKKKKKIAQLVTEQSKHAWSEETVVISELRRTLLGTDGAQQDKRRHQTFYNIPLYCVALQTRAGRSATRALVLTYPGVMSAKGFH